MMVLKKFDFNQEACSESRLMAGDSKIESSSGPLKRSKVAVQLSTDGSDFELHTDKSMAARQL